MKRPVRTDLLTYKLILSRFYKTTASDRSRNFLYGYN